MVLGVGPEALIDAALQMDGQVGDAQDGPLHVHQALLQAPRARLLKHREHCSAALRGHGGSSGPRSG